MSVVLFVENRQVCRRIPLPALNDADYSVCLEGGSFFVEENITLHFEIVNNVWRICPEGGYRLYVLSGQEAVPVKRPFAFAKGMYVRLLTADGETLLLSMRGQEELFHAYQKLTLSEAQSVTAGSGEACGICLPPESGAQSEHARITLRDGKAVLENLAEDGLYLNGEAVMGSRELAYGDVADICGMRAVFLDGILAVDPASGARVEESLLAEAAPKEEAASAETVPAVFEKPEHVLYHRSPRKLEPLESGRITIEEPPEPELLKEQTFLQMVGNSVLMVIPMIVGCSMMIASSRMSGGGTSLFMYSGLAMAGTSALVGVIWALLNARARRTELKAKENHRFEAYSAYLIRKADEIRFHYRKNREVMFDMHPSPEECAEYGRQSEQLWNRNMGQDDFMKVRLGIGDLPFQMTIDIPSEKFSLVDDNLRSKPEWIRKNYETLYQVPVLLDLKNHALTGLVGGEDKYGAYELMRIICLQLAATHCYTDLKMVFLYREEEEDKWAFARWLPHTWSEDRKIRYVGCTPAEISDVCYELTSVLHERMETVRKSAGEEDFLPRFVLFLSDISLIEGELLSGYVRKNDSAVGLSTLILADMRENLPNECSYFLRFDEQFHGIEDFSGSIPVLYDRIPAATLSSFAHRLTGIRVKESSNGGELPSFLTFMEMYRVRTVKELGVEERWLKNRTYDHIRGLLGVKGGGGPMYLDLHEKYHGPHGLVAGTTGSGKSETLGTYLLSLAIEYSPDDISFFVIDYKGGGMANQFADLPHMAGSISNLSGTQIQRAMVSIKAENRRRQSLFNAAGVNNINKYTQLYKDDKLDTPIPHLFIIIDEFAELKREEPDFMRELISVAQVGRSLGVHLILATQKPSGTVDDNIWSNAKFRLCLRVQSKEDSTEMLSKPDAAFITQAGRGYLQVGNDELYEMFQSGYSGAVYDPEAVPGSETTAVITRTGRTEALYGENRKRKKNSREETQLEAVIAYLKGLAAVSGYEETHQLWMPVLKNPIHLDEFIDYCQGAADGNGWKTDPEAMRQNWDLSAVIGQTDDPKRQAQKPLRISFAEGGSHAVLGSIVSGKSTLLQTIVYSLVTTYSPAYLNIYAIDYSSRMLTAFEGLPHVGGVLSEGDEEKMTRFFTMLREMLAERKNRYRGGSYSQYVRANGVTEPAILLVIDNFAAFNEKTKEEWFNDLLTFSKEGVSNGMFLLLSGGGYSMKDIPGRLAENIGTTLCLSLADRFAYSDALHILHIPVMPEANLRGRGLCLVEDEVLEFQAALALPADDDYQRMEGIRRKCEELGSFWEGPSARRVPEIPEKPVWEEFAKLDETDQALKDDRFLPIGYRQDNARVYSVDLHRTFCYLLFGQKRSGKKSLMRLMILSAMRKRNGGVILIDGEGELRDLHGTDDLKLIRDREELYRYCMDELTPLFKTRNRLKHRLLDEGADEERYYEGFREEAPVFFFIANLPWFIQAVYEDEHDMKGFMETIFRKGEGHKIYFFAILGPDDKSKAAGYEAFNLFTGYRDGIHLGGNVAQDPYLSFEYMSYADRMKLEAPGIGLLPDTDYVRVTDRVVLPMAPIGKRRQEDDSD